MAKDLSSRIAAAKAKKDKLAQQLRALEQKDKAEQRKQETRQKIIVGGLVLAYMQKDPAFAARIRELIKGGVTRPHDIEAVAELLGAAAPAPAPAPAPANQSSAAPPSGAAVDFGKMAAGAAPDKSAPVVDAFRLGERVANVFKPQK